MGQLVSCLCVSKPDRWGLLQRAILDFGRQTYADRELIVAVTDPRFAEQVEEFVERRVGRSVEVTVIQRDQRDQGGLLLQAQAAARGDYLAVWDDDNVNAADRLEAQLDGAKGLAKAAVYLGFALYHFYETGEVFFLGFEQPNAPLSQRAVPTTAIVPRKLMPAMPHTTRGTSVSATLADQFGRLKIKTVTLGEPKYAHVVGIRGDNIRGEEYHRKLTTTLPLARKAGWLEANRAEVEKALAQYIWEPAELVVSGSDGVAFKAPAAHRWSEEGQLYPIGKPADGVERTTEKV